MNQLVKMRIFILLCLASAPTHAAWDERMPLWGGTFYGMTLAEVLASASGARQNTDDNKLPFPDHGTKALATVNHVEIAGRDFNAWFMFSNGKLSRVTLTWVPKASDSPSSYTNPGALFASYAALLNLKYGMPITSTRGEFGPPIMVWHGQWISGLINIDLYADQTRLDISYGAQYAEDLKKL